MSRQGKKPKKVQDNRVYAEKVYYSQRHRQWPRYEVSKPRQPKLSDGKEKWLETKFQPRTLKSFVGKHNNEIQDSLTHMRDSFELSGSFPHLFVVYGPPGSGKSALVRVLLREMYESAGIEEEKVGKWIWIVDCESMDISKHFNKFYAFGNANIDRSIPVAYKIIVLDGADNIPPSTQQILKKVIVEQENKVKYICICRDQNKLIAHILSRGMHYRTKLMNERDAVALVIQTLCRENIGYNRHGIRELFTLVPKVDLRMIIETCQEMFVRYHYISMENVRRLFAERDKKTIRIEITKQAAIEPLPRCSVCTLFPPCKHHTIESLESRGISRRSELPRQRNGLACQEFVSTGHCSIFNKHGKCSLDHPMTVHTITSAPKRCPQCTLIWPCNHCSFTYSRRELEDGIAYVTKRLALLDQIAVEAPPLALTAHLIEGFPNFKEDLLKLKAEITLEKIKMKSSVENWLATSLCTEGEEYITKLRVLQGTFKNVFESPLLDPPDQMRSKGLLDEVEDDNIITEW
mmetsp:Transcript_20039/g.28786  ORF Transcript_20039/g.28786 Transcript_20039/m.28786 type:complete len:519 (+) Transcript_20039:89-1645(+)|eukprot:CAMPEP_0185036550 /NCGR_PEP_ID=MMETSP1103-20130426/29675_1 /TAXON_ID=36769 /ORGANISM="Paraphysomonas bandaiensis, Strain Caron Lab Isolate" /LENGTH=518 /DNA_ID=CAMNT_0027574117 /DNA_START=20 /DNA_END=1573 /DNA_ORIENTATION=-